MKRRRILCVLFCALAAAVALAVACAPSGFQSPTLIDSVRVLGTRADRDESYAKPGDTVTLETLTVDGRTTKTPPAVTYWIPFLCQDPLDDVYYACFAPGDAGAPSGPPALVDAGSSEGGGGEGGTGDAGPDADAGALPAPTPVVSGGGLAGLLVPGTDLTPYLPTGPFTFTVPTDIIARHPIIAGTDPYGLVIVFNIACAGRVKVVATDPNGGPQQIPIGCFDDAGNALGADQYVIGFSRVYVYDTKRNLNPEIDGVFFNGSELATHVGGTTIPAPLAYSTSACHGTCAPITLDMDVPQSSWDPLHKAIWVDYYATNGSLSGEARLLYDTSAGKLSDPVNPITYTPPDDPGSATLWAVVHDANDGITWVEVDITAK